MTGKYIFSIDPGLNFTNGTSGAVLPVRKKINTDEE